ncbi:MAG: hypothetical protein OQL17_02750 [Sedimenticola sp.]|uniref:DUF302 domain-containing protein n=1 Tax=Sedimenticola thiotaurini TaxID=1543721 RepID=A0A558CYV0_9GAMM|nr:hypothetical protein [Sedimenticola sp.]TVT53927.1 MAG: hypothetical protein FHK82_11115 [Sedimenticola thiotaurini]
MMRHLILITLFLQATLAMAQPPITPDDAPIIVYQLQDDYESIKSNLELAITGRGMLISKTLHISEMFERTAADTGLTNNLYGKAESLEFCNIKLSHQMSSVHPANLSICPLTIGIYTLKSQPGELFLSYQRPQMLGNATEAEAALIKLYEGIIREAME